MEGFCVKCKEMRTIKDAYEAELKNKRPAVKGTCPVCAQRCAKSRKNGNY